MEALNKMKIKILGLALVMVVMSFGVSFGQTVTLDHVDGETTPGSKILDFDIPITFYMRLTTDIVYSGITGGWKVESTDGAQWGSTAIAIETDLTGYFDLFRRLIPLNVDGIGADTVGYACALLGGTGLPAGFDEVTFSVTIGPIDSAYSGKTITVDSSFYPNSGYWKWSGNVFPSWDGPHTFQINPILSVNPVDGAGLPTKFGMSQNYPNPFNPSTNINFDLPKKSEVKLSVFNILGQEVKTLINKSMEAGSFIVDWDGTTDGGVHVSSGVYFYRLVAGDFVSTKKMMMLK